MLLFANIALIIAPLVIWFMFAKLDKALALCITIVGGYLLLPTAPVFNLPVLPSLHKNSIPAISALVALLALSSKPDMQVLPGWVPRKILPNLLVLMVVLGFFGTVLVNQESLTYGRTVLPGLSPFDGFSSALTTLMIFLPFFLGRKYLAHANQQRTLLVVLAISGALYSLLALYEVRMSPQMNRMVYGFFPHSFAQHVRGDGFRPLVFLNHGLWLAIFFALTILSAFALVKNDDHFKKIFYFLTGMWLLMTLVLSKSLGALIIVLLILPAIFLLGNRGRLLFASVIASTILLYPALRGAGWIPTDLILGWAENIDRGRALSLGFRIRNEDLLLARAQEKPFFGWGGFGRNAIFDEDGRNTSVSDGSWIIMIGQGGWVKYLGEFGLLCFPAILAFFQSRKGKIDYETSILVLLLVANLIDLIPNATKIPITFLIAGSLWGRLELGWRTDEEQEGTTDGDQTSYTRFQHRHARLAPNTREPVNQTRESSPYARKHPKSS